MNLKVTLSGLIKMTIAVILIGLFAYAIFKVMAIG